MVYQGIELKSIIGLSVEDLFKKYREYFNENKYIETDTCKFKIIHSTNDSSSYSGYDEFHQIHDDLHFVIDGTEFVYVSEAIPIQYNKPSDDLYVCDEIVEYSRYVLTANSFIYITT